VLIDHARQTLSVRQSWLSTALRCPERGRLAIVAPEYDEATGDAAAAGTAMHSAIEDVLNGCIDVPAIRTWAQLHAVELLDRERIEFKSFSGADELIHHAGNCAEAWATDVWPTVRPLGVAETEAKFNFPAFDYRGWTIEFEGTVDLVPAHSNTLWDWKSSGSAWKQRDKQRVDVQATIYALAAMNGCFGREDFYWPMEFHFGVMVRRKGPAQGHVVTVQRTADHARWVERRVRQFVDLFLDLGLERQWPALDDHFLCSKKWCPWYDLCRGEHLTADHDLYGYTPAA